MDRTMMPADRAAGQILEWVIPLQGTGDHQSLPLTLALGRVLATDIISPLDFPHWDNSAMDGYAVRQGDVQGATAEQPVTLTVIETVPAGQVPQHSVGPGQATRILTGSMVPPGADTIVIQEQTRRHGDQVEILATPQPQAFVRHRGSFRRAGERLLPQGRVLQGADLAVLAAAQQGTVSVYRRPRVVILSTGDELVELDQPLAPGQIVDSNQVALGALVQAAGGEPIPLGIVADDPQALQGAIAAALPQGDLILSSGGVSVGDHDYVDQILTRLGASLEIQSVAVKPGKPLTVARFPQGLLYFGLPGNPVSALVSFWRFVAPALRKLGGWGQDWGPLFVPAQTQQDLKAGGQRETYLWGHLTASPQGLSFALAGGSHSSGNLVTLGGCNALGVVPLGTGQIPAGSLIQVMVVGGIGIDP